MGFSYFSEKSKGKQKDFLFLVFSMKEKLTLGLDLKKAFPNQIPNRSPSNNNEIMIISLVSNQKATNK